MTAHRPLILAALCMAVAPLAIAQDVIDTAVISTTGSARPPQGPTELDSTVHAHPVSLVFAGFDSNFDRVIDKTELASGTLREWNSMTPSFSGKVSAIRFQDWAIAALGSSDAYPTRISFDRNLDSQVSKAEFEARMLSTFDRMDVSGDGLLTREELIFKAARRGARADETRTQTGGQAGQQRGQRPDDDGRGR